MYLDSVLQSIVRVTPIVNLWLIMCLTNLWSITFSKVYTMGPVHASPAVNGKVNEFPSFKKFIWVLFQNNQPEYQTYKHSFRSVMLQLFIVVSHPFLWQDEIFYIFWNNNGQKGMQQWKPDDFGCTCISTNLIQLDKIMWMWCVIQGFFLVRSFVISPSKPHISKALMYDDICTL